MDGNEKVPFPIFLSFLRGTRMADKKEEIIDSFKVFSESGGDGITPDQLIDICCDQNYADPVDRETVEALIQSCPRKDGKLDIENLVNILKIGTHKLSAD